MLLVSGGARVAGESRPAGPVELWPAEAVPWVLAAARGSGLELPEGLEGWLWAQVVGEGPVALAVPFDYRDGVLAEPEGWAPEVAVIERVVVVRVRERGQLYTWGLGWSETDRIGALWLP